MKRYVTLECNTCKRTKDTLINLTHYSPDKCVITLGCEGRLSPIAYTSENTNTLGVPPSSTSNWYPRGGSIIQNASIIPDALYNTSNGAYQQIVLAVPNSTLGYNPAVNSTLTLNLIAEQQTAKDYRQYTYRRSSSVLVINGVEDSQAKKVLRYTATGQNPDELEVYVNGVKRTRGKTELGYQIYDNTVGSAVPPNSILFNTAITGASTQIDVIVTKSVISSNVSLKFKRATSDEARISSGSWEGIDLVKSPEFGEFSLFYCDFSHIPNLISLDVKLRLDTSNPNTLLNVNTASSSIVYGAAFLLSRSGLYTQLDRQRALWAPLDGLNTNTEYLVIKLVDGVRVLLVAESAIKDIFPVLQVKRFNPPTLSISNLLGNNSAAELDNLIIIGPDT
jgi:hypothetical protein